MSINNSYPEHFVIVFASRAVADEWWRVLSTTSNTTFSNSIMRFTSQFYTHDPAQASIADSITNPQVAPGFVGNVFFTCLSLDGKLSVIPEHNITDHISGNTYFIRSKAEPSEYWYCPNSYDNADIFVSRTHRTQFCVRISHEPTNTKTIMIGSDEITITRSGANLSVGVRENGLGSLIVGHNPLSGLKFSSFENKFMAVSYGLSDMKTLIHTEDGEEWELI